jgi:multidrug resistance efflux pump
MPIQNENIEITHYPISRTHTEINDLIGNPPNWLLRSGIMMIAAVTSLILTGAYFFNYPDKLSGTGTLTSTTPPIEVISRATGYIDKIHIEEDEFVDKGDVILYISNTTDKDQIQALYQWITKYEKITDPRRYLNLEFEKGLQLGSLQSDYAGLELRYNELRQTLNDGVVFQQINNLSREIEKIKTLNRSQQKEKKIYKQELELTDKDYKRTESLNSGGAISDLDLERAKTELLQKERQYEGMNNTIIQNNIRIEQLGLEKLKLGEQRSNTIKNYQFAIAEVIARIRASVTNWTNTYTIEAPISGKLTYAVNINEQKNLQQGEPIGHIIPEHTNKKYVSAIYPTSNIGKVKKGQKAILRFDAYPYKEFGSVLGRVESISPVPSANTKGELFYEIKIPVDYVIITDYGDTIRYKPNMTLTTEIITEDKTVFARVFDQFLSLIKTQ